MFGSILRNVNEITLVLDVGTQLGCCDKLFDGSNNGKLEGLLRGGSLVSTGGKVIGSDKVIQLGLSSVFLLGNILGNDEGITIFIEVGQKLRSLDEPFDVYNDVKFVGLYLGDSLEYTDGKVIGYDEGIKVRSNYIKALGIIL